MARRRKPSRPDAIAEARRQRLIEAQRAQLRADGVDPDIAAWGEAPLSPARQAELEAKGAVLALDQRRRVKHAHKSDIWGELYTRGRLTGEQHGAVRALANLMATRAGLAGRGEARGYSDVAVDAPGDACAVTDRMLAAGVEMDLTLALVGPPSSRLLAAMLWPAVRGEHYDWRDIVAAAAHETRPEAQTALLRAAAQALADVAPAVERALARRAQARRRRRDDANEARA
jgi:hypothetical protein